MAYFNTRESRWGYSLLLKGAKHFGYYPKGQENLSMAQAQRIMEDKLARALDLKRGACALDAGCGEGIVAAYLAKNYQLRISGIDLLDWAIQKAKQNALKFGVERLVDFQVMDYTKLSFPNQSFDGVYTMETLVHSSDYRVALREFHRVLRPSGKLVLFEYSLAPEKNLASFQKKLAGIWAIIAVEAAMPSALFFSHGAFLQILQKAGFVNISVENITPHVMPMLKRFRQIAFLPYQLFKLLGLQRKFINTTAGAEGYEIAKNDLWRHNIIIAQKPR